MLAAAWFDESAQVADAAVTCSLSKPIYSAPRSCWCCCCLQDERDGRVLAVSLSLRQLLAMASQRCALLLRKVDMRASCGSAEELIAGSSRMTQEQQLLELLSQMWRGNLPKLTAFREVLIFNKEAQQQPQQQG
jgi:hypothetical protein